MPAAQERGTRDTYCFFTIMSGPNRWSESTGSTARGSNDPKPIVPEEEPYRSEDGEYDYVPPEGYAARKSRQVPHFLDRTIDSCRQEDHMESCFAFRQPCQWYMDKEFVTLLVERDIHTIKGPSNRSPFCKRQMAMDSVSWCLFWEKRHEFDHLLRFQADLFRHVIGWLTQDEEEEFKRKCDAVYIAMTDRTKKPNHFYVSKDLSKFRRHSKKTHLCNAASTVNLGTTFTGLEWNNPIRHHMTAQDVAALLLCAAMTRAGSRSRSMSVGLGSHLHFHQHNHGILELVPLTDTQIKS